MIKRIYVDNYKCLVNFDLRLQELTLLVGPNGVGKTSVLDVMFALRQLLSGTAKVTDSGVFSAPTLTRWLSRNLQTIEIDVVLDGDALRYRLEVEHSLSERLARIVLERLDGDGGPLFRCERGEVHLHRDNHTEGPVYTVDWSESAIARVAPRNDNVRLTRFLDFMRKVVVCGLYPASFLAESASEDAVLERDARNFAAWYRHLLLERQDLVHGFTEELRRVIDGFRDVRMEKVGLDTRAMIVMFETDGEQHEFRLNEISDGQRALLTLYSLIRLAAGQGYMLFLDEPDNYLALCEIQPWLMELVDVCGDTVPQAVLCSHHPELIDYLGVDSGVELRRERAGVTTVRRLSEAPAKGGVKLSEMVAREWQS
ncbi:MAG: AAA family ATPase [Planctomycetota bacterium]